MFFGWFKRPERALMAPASPQAPSELARLEAALKERDADRNLTLEILATLKPGLEPKALAESIRSRCEACMGLATFYLALVDYEHDTLDFPLYCEGGKARIVATRVFSEFGGLTTRVLRTKEPLYFPELRLQEEAGVAFTDAERITGLIPESWYGVPLGVGAGWPERPFGVLSFQSFPKDAFSASRREVMETVGAALALALKTDPGRPLSLG